MLLKLTDQQVATIIANLNGEGSRDPELAAAISNGTLEPTHADCISFHAAKPDQTDDESEAFRSAAQKEWANDECEIDGDAFVSASDEGAFVAAWVWVTREEAGLDDDDVCSECDEPLPEAGDGYDGLCAGCADEKESTDAAED